MSDYERKSFGDVWLVILAIIMGLVLCAMINSLTSCKTRYITNEVPVVLHERDSIVTVQQFHTHDTLLMRDSVYHYIHGDTVIIERWHQLQAINNIVRVDTVTNVVEHEKPVTVTTTEIKEVNRLKWWQKTLMWLGGGLVLFGGFRIYRRFS